METVLIIALGVLVYMLWQRVMRLEERVASAERDTASLSRKAIEEQAPAAPHLGSPVPVPTEPARQVRTPQAGPMDVEALERQLAQAAIPASAKQGEEAVEMPRLPEDEAIEGPAAASRKPRTFDFEDLFGRLLPIWAGGITLAVAGYFIVRYSIEAGLLTPAVRVLLGLLFGLGLVGGAEAAFRFENRLSDPRVRQALAGAGIATLYASLYLAGSLYGLIAPIAAFVGLAGLTGAAVALSYRFGMPSAVLGLIGGFAAPLLAGGEEANVPLLTLYLALVTAGLMVSARQRRWAWLGLAALGGGLAWGLLLLVAGVASGADIFAVGAFVVVLGAVLPAFVLPQLGDKRWLIESIAAGIAALQMALLVGQSEYSLLAWGMFVLLASALALLGWRNAGLRRASAFAGLLIPLLMLGWGAPDAGEFALVVSLFALLLAGGPVILAWFGRSNPIDHAQLAVSALGLLIAVAWHADAFGGDTDRTIALAAFALAVFPLIASWRLWPAKGTRASLSTLGLSATAMVLLLIGGTVDAPRWAGVLVAAPVAAGWLWLARGRADAGMWNLGWGITAVGIFLLVTQGSPAEFGRLAGEGLAGPDFRGALRWAAMAAVFAGIAMWEYRHSARRIAEAGSAVLAYGAAAQLLPADPLAWLAAIGAVAAVLALPCRIGSQAALAAIASLWAAGPLAQWSFHGLLALGGEPMLVNELPSLRVLALHILPFVTSGGAIIVAHRGQLGRLAKPPLAALAALAIGLLLVSLHIAFKQVFAISSAQEFASLGLAERTAWELMLVAGAWLALRAGDGEGWRHHLARLLCSVALAHWLWFTLLIHNPLWSEQAVGPWPLANLLLPVYAIGLGILAWMRRQAMLSGTKLRPVFDGSAMLLIALLTLSELRQLFAGTWLVGTPVGQLEDLLRSLAGILLAAGFLLWGTREEQRNWRIGSLVLMLLAVCKVFLVDAAGLEGLARIASFVVLGFSLIGIGWFYSRQLRPAESLPMA